MIKRWQEYLSSISDYHNNKNYSPLWENMIKDFVIRKEKLIAFDSFVKHHCRGYAFINSRALASKLHEAIQLFFGGCMHSLEKLGSWIAKYPLQKISFYTMRMLGKINNKNYNVRELYDWRLFKIWNFLRKESVDIQKYLEQFKHPLKLKLTYNTLKTIYFFDKLVNICDLFKEKKLSVMEVGAGTGNFAIMMAKQKKNLDYYIVDLPEMLLVASHEINKYVTNAKQTLPNEISHKSKIDSESGGISFYFLTPEQAALIPEDEIDLVINIESFAEMDQEIANNYVELMYASLRKGGLMFIANRESREISREGKIPKITTFWKYPFLSTDEMILIEYCPMRDYLTNKRSRNINRIARKC